MPKTVEAFVDERGTIRLLEPVALHARQRILVTILEEEAKEVRHVSETALLSEEALGKDWNREEEDEAWAHLQPDE